MSSDRLQDYLPEDADYAISEEDHHRLWRAHSAATLLAALNNDVATGAGISHDGPAAVADYIREELLGILGVTCRLREPANGAAAITNDSDLI